jgi:hypothetical protein
VTKWGPGAADVGFIACAFPDNQGNAEIIWTRDSSLFMAHVDGPDIASLMQWWSSTGNKAG